MISQIHSERETSALYPTQEYRLLSLKLNWISNHLLWESKILYQSLNIKMEPKWVSVLSTLASSPQMGVTDIAKALDLQHPSINAIIKELTKVGYVEFETDEKDRRRRIVSFTKSGENAYKLADPIWRESELVLSEIIDHPQADFLEKLDHIIEAFKTSSYSSRVISRVKQQRLAHTTEGLFTLKASSSQPPFGSSQTF